MAKQPKPFTPEPRLSFNRTRTKPVVVEKVKRSAPPKTRLDDERHRALVLLAESPEGYSRAVMLARGFSLALLKHLIRAGLAISHLHVEDRGDRAIEIVRVKITDAGRRAL